MPRSSSTVVYAGTLLAVEVEVVLLEDILTQEICEPIFLETLILSLKPLNLTIQARLNSLKNFLLIKSLKFRN